MGKIDPVWWVNAQNYRVKHTQMQPYFEGVDHASGNDMLSEMSKLSGTLREKTGPLDLETSRLQLRWDYPKMSAKERDIPDFSKISMGILLISEAMKDLLEVFDLGQTQILELSLYDAVRAYGHCRADPDLSKKDPRRWFLLHILEE